MKDKVLNKTKNETEQLFKVIVDSVIKNKDTNSALLDYTDIAKKSKDLRATARFSAETHDKIEALFSSIDNKSELWHKEGNNYSHDMLALIKSLNDEYQEYRLLHSVWFKLPNGTYKFALNRLFFNKLSTFDDMLLCFEYCMPLNRIIVERFMNKVKELVKNGGLKDNRNYNQLCQAMYFLAVARGNNNEEKKYFVDNAIELCDKYFPKSKEKLLDFAKINIKPKIAITTKYRQYS